jgi:hypothetical protein
MSWQAATALIKAESARKERREIRIAKLKSLAPWVMCAVVAVLVGLRMAGIIEPLVKFEYGHGGGSYYDDYDYVHEWGAR